MSYICDCVKIYCRYVFAVYTHIAFEGGTYCVWSQCKCAPNVVNYPTVRKEMTCWIASMIFAIPCNPKIWLHWTKRPRSETPGFVFFREVVAWKMNYTLFHSQLFEWNILHMFVGQRRSCDLTPFLGEIHGPQVHSTLSIVSVQETSSIRKRIQHPRDFPHCVTVFFVCPDSTCWRIWYDLRDSSGKLTSSTCEKGLQYSWTKSFKKNTWSRTIITGFCKNPTDLGIAVDPQPPPNRKSVSTRGQGTLTSGQQLLMEPWMAGGICILFAGWEPNPWNSMYGVFNYT